MCYGFSTTFNLKNVVLLLFKSMVSGRTRNEVGGAFSVARSANGEYCHRRAVEAAKPATWGGGKRSRHERAADADACP
jgi:hypothetical protein